MRQSCPSRRSECSGRPWLTVSERGLEREERQQKKKRAEVHLSVVCHQKREGQSAVVCVCARLQQSAKYLFSLKRKLQQFKEGKRESLCPCVCFVCVSCVFRRNCWSLFLSSTPPPQHLLLLFNWGKTCFHFISLILLPFSQRPPPPFSLLCG